MESPIILQTNRLKLYYGAFEALKGIDMQIPEKQITAFIGPSGCGKSTFLKTLNRMNDLVPGVRIEGEAVWSLTSMFLSMWNYIVHSTEDYSRFMPAQHQKAPFENDGFVQPYGDSPLDHENVGENIYLNIINRAKNYVYIFTPYLIIDHEMLTALCNAAKDGVDVRIVTPGIPDKKMIFLLTQSYYAPLIQSGVKIYQYTPGFIHAKCFVCDDEIATVGSVNLDFRSLYLHFECGVFFYRSAVVAQVREDCLNTFACSEQMTAEFCRNRPVPVRLLQSVLRLLAPLL